MDKKEQTRRLPGFYIALCCCVIAIGVAGYFTEKNTSERANKSISAVQSNADANTDADAVAVNELEENIDDTRVSDAQQEADAVADETEISESLADVSEPAAEENTVSEAQDSVETAVIVGTPAFSLPENAQILAEFSNELAFNTSLNDWRTHNGIDIAVENGGSVTAMSDGKISEISSDEMGNFVVIENNGGFEGKYCGLSSVEDINEGDEIKSGDVLGIVTESKGENTAESHLHFELYKDGSLVNPSEYIK